MHRTTLLALALVAIAGPSLGGVPAGVNGTWYNPQASGHGFNLEVIDADRAVALWYAYTPDGKPLTLYLDGSIEDDRVVATAYAPSGMRFGSFDPADLVMRRWGEVDIVFAGCGNATVTYRGDDASFGSGSFPLRRLAGTAPTQCRLDAPSTLPAGLYSGPWNAGFVDDEQTLFAVSAATWDSAHGKTVYIGEPVQSQTGEVRMHVRALYNDWLCDFHFCSPWDPADHPPADLRFEVTAGGAAAIWWSHDLTPMPIASFGTAQSSGLSGTHALDVSVRNNTVTDYRLEVSQGHLCLRRGSSGCVFEGTLAADGRFQLVRTDVSGMRYHGRAFVDLRVGGQVGHVIFIGADADSGMAFCAAGVSGCPPL
jgi:hypothetical protein